MKKLLLSLSLTLFIFLTFFASPIFACEFELSPSSFNTKVGETVNFSLEVYQDHRRCFLPIEDTEIIISGGTIVNQNDWVLGAPNRLEFSIKFTEAGEGFILIERECSKEGMQDYQINGIVTESSQSFSVNSSKQEDIRVIPEADAHEEEPVVVPEKIILENVDNTSPLFVTFEKTMDLLEDNLWYFFILGGLALYLLKFEKLRKPWLLLSVVFLGFYYGGCPCVIGDLFKTFTGQLSFILLLTILISLFWGRVFCGWTCPMGAVQEALHVKKLRITIPDKLDSALRYLKYIVLFSFIYLTITTGEYSWGDYDPFKVLFNFNGSNVAIISLIVIGIAAMFIERPFCRYLCPLGAVLTITSNETETRPHILAEKCVGCNLCAKGDCTMNAIYSSKIKGSKPHILYSECINCLKCLDFCRKKAITTNKTPTSATHKRQEEIHT